jgi:hypothetical protein
MTLRKKDMTLFIKRLRQLQDRDEKTPNKWPKIKYYVAGEYGDLRKRPHYHMVIFNLYNILNIGKAWKNGEIHIGESVTGASIAYTAKYIDKAKRIPEHRNDDRQREYAVMSKYLGASYYNNPSIVKYHQADPLNRNFVSIGSIKQAMPKYYRTKIFTRSQILAQNRHSAKLALENEELLRTSLIGTDQTYFEAQKALKVGREQLFYNNKKIREI